MIRILLTGIAVLSLSLGYFIWRVDHLNGINALLEQQKSEITVVANKNAEVIDLLKEQRRIDQTVIESLRKKNETITVRTKELNERLRHEKDAVAAPVLRCAINERLCGADNTTQ